MKFFKKVARGVKKFSSFSGKVLNATAKGGIVSGLATGVTNIGGSSKSKKPARTLQLAQNASFEVGGYSLETPQDKAQKNLWLLIGGGLLVLAFTFFRKK